MTATAGAAFADPFRVYVGTYTRGDSKGIYTFELDTESGAVSEPRLAAELVNPSFVAFDPSEHYLFAVNEVSDFAGADGKSAGGVTGFTIDHGNGNLAKINSQLSGGPGPCHLTVDRSGKCVIAVNYGGGSVVVLPIAEGGKLGKASCFIQHEGKSIDPRRQEGPHAHSVNIDANNRFAMVCDLGLDKVLVYRLDPGPGTLTPNTPPSVSVHPGGGPRHFSFHPSGRFAYCCNEMQSTVTAFSYDPENGVLHALETQSTLPADYGGKNNSTAECLCHPSGQFVYVSNRGHNSIAVFQVKEDGTLKSAGQEPTQGEIPRNFGIDPTGKFLLAANQNSANIVLFAIDQQTGALKATGKRVSVPNPVCVRFIKK